MRKFEIRTRRRTDMIDITAKVREAVRAEGRASGICTVFVPHTTAGVTINENADPDVRRDILAELEKVIPFDDHYTHGEGNSAAHIKTVLTGSSAQVIVENGMLCLGTWQSIFLCEFDGGRTREVWVKVT